MTDKISHDEDPRIGQIVGDKYRLVRLLGEGGMGRVYEAQHTTIGRRFAIKCLHSEHSRNGELVARFQREAQAAGGLENENIAAVFDLGSFADGVPYLAMEYLEGEDLGRLLARTGPLPVPRATYIILQACRGLLIAHARGIIHRDLKPENLFVCRRNDGSDLVKILDFGIAKLHADAGVTRTGATMGTPAYMSLEQARGAKEVDRRTDVYALGVILYEMLSGQKPHPGESYSEILYHLFTQEAAPVETLRPNLPAGLAAVVHRAMARDPGDRYPSVMELAEALAPFADRAVTPLAAPALPADASAETVASPRSLSAVMASAQVSTTDLRSLRRPRRALTVGALVLLAAIVAIVLVVRIQGERQPDLSATRAAPGPSSVAPKPTSAQPEPSVVPVTSAEPEAQPEPATSGTRPGGRPPGQPKAAGSPRSPRATGPVSAPKNPAVSRPISGARPRPFDRKNPYGG
ncbi:MAG: protein kinase [Polyangiaceae bacterium]|nr:protein kinase [Polyangiaceae bacterium]